MTAGTIYSLILTSVLSVNLAAAEVLYVVANASGSSLDFSRDQIRNLYMGGQAQGELEAVAMTPGSKSRVVFNTKVLGLTESRIQSYWAQMRFTGRSKPPKEVESVAEMLEYIRQTPMSLGYLPADIDLPEFVDVVFSIQ